MLLPEIPWTDLLTEADVIERVWKLLQDRLDDRAAEGRDAGGGGVSDYEKLLNEAVDHIRALTGGGTPLDKCGDCWYCGGGMECRPGCPYVKARKFLARDEIAGRCAELS